MHCGIGSSGGQRLSLGIMLSRLHTPPGLDPVPLTVRQRVPQAVRSDRGGRRSKDGDERDIHAGGDHYETLA